MHQEQNRLALAYHYLGIGQPQRTLDLLQQPTQEEFNDVEFWYVRGQALFDLDRFEEAAQAARTGLAQAPHSVALLALLSNCATELGDLAASEQALLSALRLAPEEPDLIARYALLVARAGQFAKADQLIARAEQIDPECPDVAHTRALISYLRGDDKQLKRDSREMLTTNPESVAGHYLMGTALSAQGKVDTAAQHLRTAAQLNPSEQVLVEEARAARYRNHWLLWPLLPLYRFGPIKVWFGFIIVFFGLQMVGLRAVANIFAVLYLIIVIYSWTVPWLLRRWLRWRGI